MAVRVYHSAVSLSSYHGSCLFHLCRDIHLAHGSRGVCAAISLCDITQGTCRREVGDGIELRVAFLLCHLREDIVGNRDEGVFLSEHHAVLTDESEAVDIRVYDNAKVILS